MRRVFADTSFFLALFEKSSKAHAAAVEASRSRDQSLVLSSAIVFELGAALALEADRPLFLKLIEKLHATPQHQIVQVDQSLEIRAVELFRQRPDKDWSLADCSSILIMEDLQLRDVLTTDHHFRQAGFNVLLPLPSND
jgi:predicted nucleic acid-binding protein